MNKNTVQKQYSNWQLSALTVLRALIGWHFLYEGLVKIYTPGWTARYYLLGASGPLAPLFKGMARNESILFVVDILNEWGLILIGLSLFIGLLGRQGKLFGIALLLLYYMAYPPFPILDATANVEGSYWIVNKNLIEMTALFVLFLFPTSHITGIDRFLFNKINKYS